MLNERSSGIILHITSLPGPYGIGDLGPEARRFADFLAEAEVKYWQILPLNPIEKGTCFSPYSSASAFAGNPWLLSPELLVTEGWLEKKDMADKPAFGTEATEYEAAGAFKEALIRTAYERFQHEKDKIKEKKYEDFCRTHASWLSDYALFTALRSHFDGRSWLEWPTELRDRQHEALKQMEEQLAREIAEVKFGQFLFFEQWEQLKTYCAERDVYFFGDLPFYVSFESVDVWASPQYFKLDEERKPVAVSGVPPDYFSETGQLWGTPVYNWERLRDDGYSWWLNRLAHNLRLFGVVRIDHFRAFYDYWEVPAGEKTAVNGHWQSGPANSFFDRLSEIYPDLPFIAEDLGDVNPGVYQLRDHYQLPGMVVLQYGFGSDIATSIFAPHNHRPNMVIYTGTHDNNTSIGWYKQELKPTDRKRMNTYLQQQVTKQNVHEVLVRLAMMSVGQLAIVPLQDLLGLDETGIMNKPGAAAGNWEWRLQKGQLSKAVGRKLKEMVQIYGRGRML